MGDALGEVVAELFGGPCKRVDHMPVRDGRVFDWDVMDGRPLVAHGGGVDDAVERFVIRLVADAPGRAHTDERVGAAFNQLLNRDGCGRAAHAGGGNGNLDAV